MAEERRRGETNLRIGGINHFAIEVADLDATIAALRKRASKLRLPGGMELVCELAADTGCAACNA